MGYNKTFFIPEAKGLRQNRLVKYWHIHPEFEVSNPILVNFALFTPNNLHIYVSSSEPQTAASQFHNIPPKKKKLKN